ncbi:RNA 3'-terminal phosphate cyclase [Eumeta japonica]|uniref:RNA 3'-terminal phosphate cyclase n=1 Tax=Eumeta variegata TaxID=151549 RepID=A0A4C1WJI7_EUMVA|nr:RNA 3'-terminal phosphate cyclase [Eumeta japonica]
MDNIMEIDGSVMEGGGQILRMSVAFSAIMGKPVRVTQIRAGRSKPGLAAQHLTGLQLLTKMCQGKLKGGEIGSTQIEFWPGKLKGGHYVADTHTAGRALTRRVPFGAIKIAEGIFTLVSDFPHVFHLPLNKQGELSRKRYFTQLTDSQAVMSPLQTRQQ